jgi:hypothetical protein
MNTNEREWEAPSSFAEATAGQDGVISAALREEPAGRQFFICVYLC